MKCPICDKSSFVEWCKVESYSIIKCKKCGVGVTAPFPTKEQLIEFNKKTYDVEQRIKIYLSRQDYFEKRYKGYIKNIKTTKKYSPTRTAGLSFKTRASKKLTITIPPKLINKKINCRHYAAMVRPLSSP